MFSKSIIYLTALIVLTYIACDKIEDINHITKTKLTNQINETTTETTSPTINDKQEQQLSENNLSELGVLQKIDIDYDKYNTLYFDIITENVYIKTGDINTAGFTIYYFGNYPLRYNLENKTFYYVDNNSIAHIADINLFDDIIWETDIEV